MISITVISRGTVLVDGGKEAGGFLGVASVGVDLSTETLAGNVLYPILPGCCRKLPVQVSALTADAHFSGLTSSKNRREKATQDFILPWKVILIRSTSSSSSFADASWSMCRFIVM